MLILLNFVPLCPLPLPPAGGGGGGGGAEQLGSLFSSIFIFSFSIRVTGFMLI